MPYSRWERPKHENVEDILKKHVSERIKEVSYKRDKLFFECYWGKSPTEKINAFNNFVTDFSGLYSMTRFSIEKSLSITKWKDKNDEYVLFIRKWKSLEKISHQDMEDALNMWDDKFMDDLVCSGVMTLLKLVGEGEEEDLEEGEYEPEESNSS